MNIAILTSRIEALNAAPARDAAELCTRNATIAKLRQRIAALSAPSTCKTINLSSITIGQTLYYVSAHGDRKCTVVDIYKETPPYYPDSAQFCVRLEEDCGAVKIGEYLPYCNVLNFTSEQQIDALEVEDLDARQGYSDATM